MSAAVQTDYIGTHRPFADRCTYTEWTDMIVEGQTRDNVAKLLGYDYEPRHSADFPREVAE